MYMEFRNTTMNRKSSQPLWTWMRFAFDRTPFAVEIFNPTPPQPIPWFALIGHLLHRWGGNRDVWMQPLRSQSWNFAVQKKKLLVGPRFGSGTTCGDLQLPASSSHSAEASTLQALVILWFYQFQSLFTVPNCLWIPLLKYPSKLLDIGISWISTLKL
jgi:hypothetical protein